METVKSFWEDDTLIIDWSVAVELDGDKANLLPSDVVHQVKYIEGLRWTLAIESTDGTIKLLIKKGPSKVNLVNADFTVGLLAAADQLKCIHNQSAYSITDDSVLSVDLTTVDEVSRNPAISECLRVRVLVKNFDITLITKVSMVLLEHFSVLESLIDEKENVNFHIIVGDRKIGVQRMFLANGWGHYDRIKEDIEKEGKKRLRIKGHEYDVVRSLIGYLYSGIVTFHDIDYAFRMFRLVNKYEHIRLQTYIDQYLKDVVSEDNVSAIKEFYKKSRDTQLRLVKHAVMMIEKEKEYKNEANANQGQAVPNQ